MARLQQIQMNLRAVVGDVLTEVQGFNTMSKEISLSSLDLANIQRNYRPRTWSRQRLP